jgi:hypothetical protein
MNDGEGVTTNRYTTRFLLQSLPLLLFPRFLAFLAYSGPQQDVLLTPLERFMATTYALLLLATALCVIIAVRLFDVLLCCYLCRRRHPPHHR